MGRLAQWHKLPVTLAELCIDTALRCGQSFRWRKFDDEWRCSLHGRIISLRQDAEYVYYKSIYPDTKKASTKASPASASASASVDNERRDDTEALLRSYFNLKLDLGALYAQWSRDDANFRKKAPKFSGIRILNQDAWEALVCFICSSNNNIPRISQMAHKLCLHYGPFLGTVDGEAYHDFPTPTALAAPDVEGHLRQLGFGYRAKYIAQTAKYICNDKPRGWLVGLRNPRCPDWPPHLTEEVPEVSVTKTPQPEAPTYKHAQEQLLTLSGVGPKVSDCVCLMGLGWGEAVPVDTHVWQIAVRDYKFKKQTSKTFSGMHDAVGDHFRNLWGEYAGWAHQK
ncbi:n-glycosylase dna lyase [Ophiostoma piceae UAMH 11346]|uniref:DNA-(apurinic or apyrimidinic site) lyase n=1 Tax=Ophiostoma piceae (strain UAMH 11346) TaxID=1262450 RepID=S3BQ44_OPHP1|nr:n-glycosylase dna lyase [Ophiostoma piceae UAMH 11346]